MEENSTFSVLPYTECPYHDKQIFQLYARLWVATHETFIKVLCEWRKIVVFLSMVIRSARIRKYRFSNFTHVCG